MRGKLTVLMVTAFVDMLGLIIVYPLLPFYAQTFGASPVAIGVLFASFSVSQLIASPVLGEWSDRWGRRPVLIFSLLGTVVSFAMLALAQSLLMLFAARIIDGLSGGNITTARAYIADVTEPHERAKAYGMLGAAFGLGFIVGPALAGVFSHISYTAPIWAAAAVTVIATAMAWFWLPETVHRGSAATMSPWRALPDVFSRRQIRPLLMADFLYWASFSVCNTTFALFASRRFGFDVAQTGYVLAAFGFLGVIVQVGMVGPIVRALGVHRTFLLGLVIAGIGWAMVGISHSLAVFLAALVPAGIGVGLCNAALITLVSHAASKEEQGKVQGAAGALESLGRTIGPVWGNGALQRFGEASPYASAAAAFIITCLVMLTYHPPAES